MAVSSGAHEDARFLGLEDVHDPDIEKILDEADLMEAVSSVF